MLSKKSPQKICGIRNWNERIRAHAFLNHHCASTLALESMLLGAPLKNTFSTASTRSGPQNFPKNPLENGHLQRMWSDPRYTDFDVVSDTTTTEDIKALPWLRTVE